MRVLLLFLFIAPWVSAEEIIGLGKLRIDMVKSDVISELGQPKSKEEQADFITDIYKYSNIEAYFNGDHLVGIYTNAKDVCTPENICPGVFVKYCHFSLRRFPEKVSRCC